MADRYSESVQKHVISEEESDVIVMISGDTNCAGEANVYLWV